MRSAFERLHERQRLAFADRVATRYGLADGEEITELPTDLGRRGRVPRDRSTRQVAAIMKEWTF